MDKQKRNLLITIVGILIVFIGGTVAYNLLKDRTPTVGMTIQLAPDAQRAFAETQIATAEAVESHTPVASGADKAAQDEAPAEQTVAQDAVVSDEREAVQAEAQTNEEPAEQEEDTRLLMLDIPLYNLDDQEVSFEAVRAGRPAIINYFASWCPPCIAELPHFEAAFQAHGDEIAFIFLNALDGQRETKETLRRFIIERAFSGPVYWDEGLFAYLFQTTSLPTTIFIASDGEILGGQLGFVSEEQLSYVIEELLR